MQKKLKHKSLTEHFVSKLQKMFRNKLSSLRKEENADGLPHTLDTQNINNNYTPSYIYYSRAGVPGELVLNRDYLFIPKENPLYHLNTPCFQPCFIHNNILFNVKVSKS